MPSIKQLFSRKDVHPLVVDVALLQVFGPDWMGWDSDSTSLALAKQFGEPPSRSTQRKIDALAVLHSNHAYWEDWRAFEAVSWALSGKEADLGRLTPLAPVPMIYGIRTARWVDSKPQFSDEVRAYIVATMLHDQFSLMPPDLTFAQAHLFESRPDLKERAEKVKALILAGSRGSGVEDAGDNPEQVEVTRHHVIDSVLRMVCSREYVLEQADVYGLRSMLENLIGGK